MPSRDVNAMTRLAEASWRRDNVLNTHSMLETHAVNKIACREFIAIY